ncbi:MAG: energy transducer TonB [Pseudomonadota bacterium]
MNEIAKTNTTLRPTMARSKRMLGVAIPAGAVTFGLFLAMQNLIAADAPSASDLPVYELIPYMEVEIEDPVLEPRPTINRRAPVAPPPSAPKLAKSVKNPKLPLDSYAGAAPAEYTEPSIGPIVKQRTSVIENRTIQPITPPVPDYPRAAASDGIEGACDVFLNVSTKGEPFNVQAECSHRVFVHAAEKAVRKVKFAPQIRDGLPVTVTGVVYPLEFRLKQ